MNRRILSDVCVTLSRFKENPTRAVRSANGAVVAVLDHGRPAFYCVPPRAFSAMMELVDDARSNTIADARRGQRVIKTALSDL